MEVFMNFINAMFGSILSLDPVSAVKMVVMWAIGGTLIYLAIKKDMEPEMAHIAQSKHILDDFAKEVEDMAVVEKAPKQEGRSISMVLAEKR